MKVTLDNYCGKDLYMNYETDTFFMYFIHDFPNRPLQNMLINEKYHGATIEELKNILVQFFRENDDGKMYITFARVNMEQVVEALLESYHWVDVNDA